MNETFGSLSPLEKGELKLSLILITKQLSSASHSSWRVKHVTKATPTGQHSELLLARDGHYLTLHVSNLRIMLPRPIFSCKRTTVSWLWRQPVWQSWRE